jgi:hypothetical protein
MPKVGVAQFSDLSGPTNPTGILSPSLLMLKQALDRGDDPENVKQALFDWISSRTQRGGTADQVEKLLELPPDKALHGLIQLIGAGMDPSSLPALVTKTLRRTLAHIAGEVAHREGRNIAQTINRMRALKKRFTQEDLVNSLLDG